MYMCIPVKLHVTLTLLKLANFASADYELHLIVTVSSYLLMWFVFVCNHAGSVFATLTVVDNDDPSYTPEGDIMLSGNPAFFDFRVEGPSVHLTVSASLSGQANVSCSRTNYHNYAVSQPLSVCCDHEYNFGQDVVRK